jgi:hypothetical protein
MGISVTVPVIAIAAEPCVPNALPGEFVVLPALR